jgi:RHS repeat-associated protein
MATLTKSGVTTTYSIDGNGRRVRKFSSTGAASTVIFAYDQAGQLLGEYDQTGKSIREYVWMGSTPVAVFMPDPAAPAGNPIVHTIHTDHLDTPRVVLDKDNAVRWRWLAEPFGTTAPETNPSNLGAFTFNLRFRGQYFDAESGLNQNYFRDLDPTVGRYAQSDPIGLGGGVNTYAYVNGNPLSRIDPLGLFITTVDAACMQDPSFCAEVAGQMVKNAAAMTGDACVEQRAEEIAQSLQSTSTLLSVMPVMKVAATHAAAAVKGAGHSVDDLSQAAAAADRGGLSAAGRGLQKHGGRPGSAFPAAKGNPSSVNQQGQHVVDDILTSPGSTMATRHHARFGQVTEVRAPDGRGVRYGPDGKFIGFLEP